MEEADQIIAAPSEFNLPTREIIAAPSLGDPSLLAEDRLPANLSSAEFSSDSQSSAGAPPDITSAETSFTVNETFPADPPDLNPENTDLPDDITKQDTFLSPTYEAAELSDSSGPPDITNSDRFDKIKEEVDETDLHLGDPSDLTSFDDKTSDYPEVYTDPSSPLLESLEEAEFGTDFGTDIPGEPQDIFTSDAHPPDLLTHNDYRAPEEGSFLSASFPEANFSESLAAVAPGDILPVVSFPQANPQFVHQPSYQQYQVQPKRGPGRPRKDGLDPLPSISKKKP